MKGNRGVTLVELIIVVALMFIVLPFAWNYINSSIEDSANINNKVAVQSSVNALMSQLQKDIQEARYPINPNTGEYTKVEGKGFLICKPRTFDESGNVVEQNVLYKFDEENRIVEVINGVQLITPGSGETDYEIDISDATTGRYDYIKTFKLEKVYNSDDVNNRVNNGVKVEIRGEIDQKSGYSLSNVYYTRNTIF